MPELFFRVLTAWALLYAPPWLLDLFAAWFAVSERAAWAIDGGLLAVLVTVPLLVPRLR